MLNEPTTDKLQALRLGAMLAAWQEQGRQSEISRLGFDERFGLLVERLSWQQELVIKSVDERWIDTGVVAGASILGDGRVVLILDALAARAFEQPHAGVFQAG